MVVIAPEMVLALQTVFVVLLFVSMGFRMKGKYSVHAIIMIVAVAVVSTGFTAVFVLAAINGEAITALTSPVLFGVHGFFGVLALASGIWLVALWRPRSTEFAAKSKRIWQLTSISWIIAFLIGIVLYAVLHTTLFA